jgi:superfamily II DNA or RNA helicase
LSACATSARRSSPTPEAYRKEQIERRMPEDFDELPEDEQHGDRGGAGGRGRSIDPEALRDDIACLTRLIQQARALEKREVESKMDQAEKGSVRDGIFEDPKMKLLIFTEHKDTLDYLAGDGRDDRPWASCGNGVSSHPDPRRHEHRRPRHPRQSHLRRARVPRDAQVLVATEAAGEGINLQFCWLMINYDIPWNPVRLEQRMGRIHRYGQEHDCLIFNFRRDQHPRGPRPVQVARTPAGDPQRAGHGPGLRRGRRGLSLEPA